MIKKILLSVIILSVLQINYAQKTIKYVLVKNINTKASGLYDESSYPRNFIILNDKLIFVAQNEFVGNELFITDGTSEGTNLLKNIDAYHQDMTSTSDNSSQPYELTVFSNKLIFGANDDIHGYEPWITDGTSQGTILLKDIYQNSSGSDPNYFVEYNDKIYFNANEGWGNELYVSDGNEQGTFMLKNISTSGYGSSEPSNFIVYKNLLFFSAIDTAGNELWRTDGTEPGTCMFKDLSNEAGGSSPTNFFEYQNKLFFSAIGDSTGRELWITDGTKEGTYLFKDINLNKNEGSFPHDFIVFNDNLYFIAADSVDDNELWCTNGDSAYMIKEISPHTGALSYSILHEYNGRLYFNARMTELSEFTLWTSDGTEEGTYEFFSVDTTTNDTTSIEDPEYFINWQDKLIFKAQKEHTENNQLWISDGTMENTKQLFPDSVVGWSPINGSEYVLYKDEIYFSARFIDSIGVELYKLIIDSVNVSGLIDRPSFKDNCKVYPNPVSNTLYVELDSEIGLKIVSITDINGRTILSKKTNNDKLELDLFSLQSGFYILDIKTSDKNYLRKILKE